MTDFNFTKADGTINVTIQTDLIGIQQGSELCTVHDLRYRGSNNVSEKALFVNFQKVPTSKTALAQFAISKNLTLKAYTVGPKTPVAPLVLNTEV